ncbi:endonuclease [Flammeovirga sp. SJP92]|uniref:endonuclease n=1 Tax=Flammeovirga sp. SJP92 TaxID=1775430 RepID=UPI00078794C4|nr:endonuclease [Flammeovirga sp. SJP92]KXX70302.1 hypothetical protein AVL50_11900 [Flammeovirga sp. SJP92]
MKQFFFNKYFITLVVGVLFLGCVDKTYNDPENKEITPIPEGSATMSIADLKAMHSGRDNDTTGIPEDVVIVGQVISDDEAGNIYKELYIQDKTGGILIRLDKAPLYSTYRLGQQVGIICDDLVLGSYGGNVQLGIPSLYNGAPAAGRVPGPLMEQYMFTGTVDSIEAITASVKEIQENSSAYLGRKVRINNITSTDNTGTTYADAENETTQNRYFNDGTTSSDIILRNSGFSDFAGDKIPEGAGTMYAIVGTFNGTPQLLINNPATDMVDFTDEGDPTDPEEDGKVLLDENFDELSEGEVALDNWTNSNEQGTVKWEVEGNGNKYAFANAYKSGDEASEAWLVLPTITEENLRLRFRSAAGFFVEGHLDVLEVKVSSNYNGSISSATWSDVTDQADLPVFGNPDGDWWDWKESDINLSSFGGNVTVAFVYHGSNTNSTKVEVDNIVISNDAGSETDPEDGDYYGKANGKEGYALKTALADIITNGHKDKGYSALWTLYQTSDDKYQKSEIIWDMYSDIPDPNNPSVPDGRQEGEYEYELIFDQCGQAGGGEKYCYNREHVMPQSWFDKKSPMVSDAHHIIPTDAYVNTKRSNHPHGVVANVSWTSINGSKLGSGTSASGYTGTVFEPIDEYKGDFARMYLYMATRYEDQIGSWENNSQAGTVLDGSSDKVFKDWFLTLMMEWHTNDPVSDKEIDRNQQIFETQGNRNPFIDHPEYAKMIWGN